MLLGCNRTSGEGIVSEAAPGFEVSFSLGDGSAAVSDRGTLAVELRQDAPIPLDLSFTCDPDQVLAIYGPQKTFQRWGGQFCREFSGE